MDAEIKEESLPSRRNSWRGDGAPRGIREEGIATRRHFDVVAERPRDDIRIIAEGLIALDAKVETIRDSGKLQNRAPGLQCSIILKIRARKEERRDGRSMAIQKRNV